MYILWQSTAKWLSECIYRNVIFKREIFKNLFTPRQLEKIIIILKSSILLIKLMVIRKSIRMDLVTLQDLLFLPKRLMWKNIARLFLKFGSGSEMSHIIMLQLFFFIALMHVHVRPAHYTTNLPVYFSWKKILMHY